MKLLGLYGERLNTAQDIIRMWADGKLLYDKRPGAIRVYKRGLSFKLFPGTSDQAVNPTISAAEGAANTPAFRDTACAAWPQTTPIMSIYSLMDISAHYRSKAGRVHRALTLKAAVCKVV
jgi:hypothetical protein